MKIKLINFMLIILYYSSLNAVSYFPNQMEFSPVFNRDAIDGVVKICRPGNYRIAQNLNARIIIAADEVSLDLNSREVICDNADENVITITSGAQHVNVFNGHITCSSIETGVGSGILIEEDTSSIYIQRIKVFNCGTGIKFDGNYGKEIVGCYVALCDLVSNTTGLSMTYADENVVRECRATKNKQIGYEIFNGEANYFYACQSLKTEGDGPAAAFRCESGNSNLFEKCAAKKTKTTAVDFGSKAYGFMLTGTESRTKIINCIVNGTDAIETVSAVAYGIILEPKLLDNDDLLVDIDNLALGGNALSLAWSPNSKYIATGDASNNLSIFHFDETELIEINNNNAPAANVNSVAWSPDGRLIATGDASNYLRIFLFDGYSLTETDNDSTPAANINSVDWSPDGRFLATGDSGNYLRVFNYGNSTIITVDSDNTSAASVLSANWSPDGKYIATGDAGNRVRIFRFNGSQLSHITTTTFDLGQQVNAVSWSPNGKYIASGDNTNKIRVFSFDGTSLDEVDQTIDFGNNITTIDWSPNGLYILSGDADNYIRILLFDNTSITEIDNTNATGDILNGVAWSTGGRFIASVDAGNYITIFDAMNAPTCCLLKYNTICDSFAYGQLLGIGLMGGGSNSFIGNTCGGSEINFSFGIPNVFYGDHNSPRPFENLSMPMIP